MNYSSKLGLDTQNDDPLISEICSDDIIEKLLQVEKLEEYRMDFGGGIFDVACRHVLEVCDSNPKKLCSLIGLSHSKENIEDMKTLIKEFKNAIAESAYVY